MPKHHFTRKTPTIKFEEKISMEPMTGCWLWVGAYFRRQYGQFYFEDKNQRANRVAWKLYVGPIPAGLEVLHKCDTPACVNPHHLFLGTATDNRRDCIKKDRHNPAKGERNGRCKLTANDVMEIRQDMRQQCVIARAYKMSNMTISLIKRRKIWAHLT